MLVNLTVKGHLDPSLVKVWFRDGSTCRFLRAGWCGFAFVKKVLIQVLAARSAPSADIMKATPPNTGESTGVEAETRNSPPKRPCIAVPDAQNATPEAALQLADRSSTDRTRGQVNCFACISATWLEKPRSSSTNLTPAAGRKRENRNPRPR